jgi:hypothetical protein
MTKPNPQKMSTIDAFFFNTLRTHNRNMLTTMTTAELIKVSRIMTAG